MTDTVFVGGVLANDIFMAKGFEIGKSLFSDKNADLSDLVDNKKVILPIDVIVKSSGNIFTKKPDKILNNEKIMDAGHETIALLQRLINDSKFILWNGPLGYYTKGFSDATFELIRMIARSRAESVVGGGDTEHCISKLGLEEEFDFISTGGGAMLEFVTTGTLPGIEAIENKG